MTVRSQAQTKVEIIAPHLLKRAILQSVMYALESAVVFEAEAEPVFVPVRYDNTPSNAHVAEVSIKGCRVREAVLSIPKTDGDEERIYAKLHLEFDRNHELSWRIAEVAEEEKVTVSRW